jgi:hypothetical protein
MINSTYDPQKLSDFEKGKLEFSGQSIYFECSESMTQSADYLVTDDILITGGILLVKGGKLEDRVYLQVVHPTAGVINEFISGYRISEDVNKQFEMNLPYPAKIPAGLSIRCKYVADALVGIRDIAVNFYFHKIMI